MRFENFEPTFNHQDDPSTSATITNTVVAAAPLPTAALPREDEQEGKSLAIYSQEERQIIIGAYRNLLKSITVTINEEDRKNIRKAFDLAVTAHAQQRRKTGEPYILHPIEVARICAQEIGLGATSIIAAILHDVVEDTDTTLADIKAQFGDRVAQIVDGLTKLDNTYEMDCPQAENLRRVLAAMLEDTRVIFIKMADRLHNMRTLGSMAPHKQLKIAAETDYIYAPVAHRLGLYKIKTELQDLILKVTDRKAYDNIAAQLKATKRQREAFIQDFIEPIYADLTQICPYPFQVFGRPKSIHSIWNKLKTKEVPFEDIYDLFAIRIVLDVKREVEKAECFKVFAAITEVYDQVPERLKDWITMPKSNGYESLHTTLISHSGQFVEVQIRSKRMDEIAEKGLAAHWKYKGVQTPRVRNQKRDIFDTWFEKVRHVLEAEQQDAISFLADFRATNLFKEEVFVYTPSGELRILPKDSTALDFAFEIHSEIGVKCQAVHVNGRLVQFGYKLQTGDRINVFTHKNQKPNESWLQSVKTGKAKSRIRQALREEEKHRYEFGRETLMRKLENIKPPINDFEEAAEMLMHRLNFRSKADFYHAISIQKIELTQALKRFKVEKGKLVHIEEVRPITTQPFIFTAKGDNENLQLYIEGEPASRFIYQFSPCCNPMKGDPVFAYIGSEGSYKIHRSNCPNALNLNNMYSYRIRKATWGDAKTNPFLHKLLVKGIDAGKGVVQRVAGQITNLGLNIKTFNINGNNGYFTGEITIEVEDTQQLDQAIEALESLADVSKVEKAA